jgi:NADPH-dependent 2,4-dienoyl-CoA reductase/sulfur reductase-like enzyme
MRRRTLLRLAGAAGVCAAQLGAARAATGARARVVIVGAGWGGLATAFALTRDAEAFDVRVLDREPVLRALPLSNPWLVGRTPLRLPPVDLATLARRQGWRFDAAAVQAIDRAQRVVIAGGERIGYDALVLATGAVADYAAWFGDDAPAANQARLRFPAGFAADELEACRRGLEAFADGGGGTLLTTVPPAPYRCPPAPYERAALIGWWIKSRRLKARLIVLDAGGGMPRFNRLFGERYKAQIEHRMHAPVRRVDPFRKTVTTDDGDERFDHALLLPAMHAGALVREAGLLGRDAQGAATRWAAVDGHTLRSPHDERVWIVGDAMDSVSPLFGAYPKTAHIAAEVGAAAAAQVSAALRGTESTEAVLPRSLCHVWLDADPPEQLVLDASFRRRGDGLIAQSVRQTDNPQPRDEDLQWARELMAQRLGVSLG